MPRMVIKMEDGFYIANVFMEINIFPKGDQDRE